MMVFFLPWTWTQFSPATIQFHCMLGNCHAFLSSAEVFFFKINSLKKSFRNTIRMSNSLDPDQARRFVGPDLGPNCLPRFSPDDTGRQRITLC